MQIAVISDSHDHIQNLTKALDYISNLNIKHVIHCGDIASINTLFFMLENYKHINFYIALGNNDHYSQDEINKALLYKNLKHIGRVFDFTLENKKIAVTHGDLTTKLNELILSGEYDFVFSGHIHRPYLNWHNKTIHLVPGKITKDKKNYIKNTFSIIDLKNLNMQFIKFI